MDCHSTTTIDGWVRIPDEVQIYNSISVNYILFIYAMEVSREIRYYTIVERLGQCQYIALI